MGKTRDFLKGFAGKGFRPKAVQQAQQMNVAAIRAAAPTQLRDRFGRPLLVGGSYTFDPQYPPVFQILDITPVLDPGAPPDVCRVRMRAEHDLIVRAGVPVEPLTLIGLPENPASQDTTDHNHDSNDITEKDHADGLSETGARRAGTEEPPAGPQPIERSTAEPAPERSGIVLTDRR